MIRIRFTLGNGNGRTGMIIIRPRGGGEAISDSLGADGEEEAEERLGTC